MFRAKGYTLRSSTDHAVGMNNVIPFLQLCISLTTSPSNTNTVMQMRSSGHWHRSKPAKRRLHCNKMPRQDVSFRLLSCDSGEHTHR